jgi:hypothetical protein
MTDRPPDNIELIDVRIGEMTVLGVSPSAAVRA